MHNRELMPHQISNKRILASMDRWMINDPTGAGKSTSALSAFEYLLENRNERWGADKMIVIARKKGKLSWIDDIQGYFNFTFTDMDGKEFDEKADIWLTNHVAFTKKAKEVRSLSRKYRIVLCADEAHKYKNIFTYRKTKEGKSVRAKTQRTAAVWSLLTSLHKLWLLTATPFDKPEQVYGLLRLLGAEVRGYWDFMEEFCERREIKLSTGKKIKIVTGYKNQNSYRRLLSSVSSRANPEYLRNIPTRVIRIPVEMEKTQAFLYRQACEGMIHAIPNWKDLSDTELIHEFESNMEQRHRMLQITSNPRLVKEYVDYKGNPAKYEALEEFVGNFLEENPDQGLLVWYYYKDHYTYLSELLAKYHPVFLSREISDKEQDENVRAFQSGKSRLLVSSIGIGGESINLQARCSNAIYLEIDWALTDLEQSMGRIRRTGQMRNVNFYFLTALGTYDETLHAKVGQKHEDSIRILDGNDLRLLFFHFEKVARGLEKAA